MNCVRENPRKTALLPFSGFIVVKKHADMGAKCVESRPINCPARVEASVDVFNPRYAEEGKTEVILSGWLSARNGQAAAGTFKVVPVGAHDIQLRPSALAEVFQPSTVLAKLLMMTTR